MRRSVLFSIVSKSNLIAFLALFWALALFNSQTVLAIDLAHFKTVFNTDKVAVGLGGMRNNGFGTLVVSGIGTGTVNEALLYWQGPTNSNDPKANATVNFDQIEITGENIGFSDDNCWSFSNSQGYMADVTSIVQAKGDGDYTLSNFYKTSNGVNVNINGVSLIVFLDDGDDTNNRDYVIFHGNDSNQDNELDDPGWNITLSGINYSSGTAKMELHVSDGQHFRDNALVLNSIILEPIGYIFQGYSVPSAHSKVPTLWDIKNFDVTSFLSPGLNTLNLTMDFGGFSSPDCLSAVVIGIDLPAGAAPSPQAGVISLTPELDFGPVGTDHTVTALVTDNQGDPLVGEPVTFEVVAGPNAGEQGTGTTDGNGNADFTYTGDGGTGLDQIQASLIDIQDQPIEESDLPEVITLTATIRDFHDTHPDFEDGIGNDRDFVDDTIGADRKPIYVGGAGTRTTHGETFFNQWYHDTPGVNLATAFTLPLTLEPDSSGVYRFSSNSFFPIDNQLFGNEGRAHNFHFTLELHTEFTFKPGLRFNFTGDDDLFVFINNQLVIDLGGVHPAQSASVDLDTLGLNEGQVYSFDLFFAERHTAQSNFSVETTIRFGGLKNVATALKSWTDCASNPISDLSPPGGSTFPAGSQITLSGRMLPRNPVGGSSAVQINGEPVDSLDASGRFFKSILIGSGDNLFAIEARDACGTAQTNLNLQGFDGPISGTEGFADISAHLKDQYADTTFNRTQDWLVVDAHARNVSSTTVDGPVLMAIGPELNPAVETINHHGLTEQGHPFYTMAQEGVALGPDAVSNPVTLLFQNPDQVPVRYSVRWLAFGNRPPQFSSVPPATATPGVLYAYDADALDPDGDPVTFALNHAPATMAIDIQTGEISWSPSETDTGTHEVAVLARDDRGGISEQRFSLSVDLAQFNRPPVFTSSPVTGIDAGATYTYDADAVDFDDDPVNIVLAEGPPGMTIDPDSGLVQWSPSVNGTYTVSLQANDGRGGEAVQTFALTVGSVPANQSIPQITGLPDAFAVVDELYIYQPIAIDADGDALTFSLGVNPSGMAIDPRTGLIQWTPEAEQVGGEYQITVSVSDGRGGLATQAFLVTVVTVASRPPLFQEPPPPTFAVAGQTYAYQAHAIDPDGGAVSYSLIVAPSGMTIDSGTGALNWEPGGGDIGMHFVVIEATDPSGGNARLAYEITVRASNTVPEIVSEPPLTALAENIYQYLVSANDVDGDPLKFQLIQAPAGMTINSETGLISWQTTVADIGAHPVSVAVTDCCGGSAEQTYTLTVEDDIEPPSALITFSQNPVPLEETIQVAVNASDNVGIGSIALTVNCGNGQEQNLPLDASYRTTFSSEAPGICTFAATVEDTSGNLAYDMKDLQIGNSSSTNQAPIITLISPLPESEVTGPVDIIAGITDDDNTAALSWEVRIAPLGTDDFRTIGSGTGGDVTAMLDPTLLFNDSYLVEISVDDGHQIKTFNFRSHITGDLKLGNFSLSFTDLTIPVAGIPLAIIREYNSLNTRYGDFGTGWRLRLAGQVTDSAREDPEEGFTALTRVFVTRPDGRRVSFTFVPESVGFPLPSVFLPKFEPEPGEQGTLTVEPDALFQQANGQFYTLTGPYNPSRYVYTTKEGVTYTLDEVNGLQSIEDLNGNTIEVTPDGLFSSTGVSLAFQRDGMGRIYQITEPENPDDTDPPGTLAYTYDEIGNLTAFVDQLGNRTKYLYEDPNFPHFLTRIEDPLDRPLIRNVYNVEGRLIGQCDDNGNIRTLEGCSTFESDPNARVQTIINARGFRTDLFLDDRGNILREIRFLEDGTTLETTSTYDDKNNLLSQTDPEGSTWYFSYDERGNLLTVTGPSGTGVRTFSYNKLNKVETRCDESLNCTENTYDEAGNLRFVRDSAGNVREFRYNSKGRISEIIDALGNRWEYLYDEFGFPSRMNDPLGNSTTFTFDVSGRLETMVQRNGRQIVFEYDAGHRLASETWDTTPPTVISYTHNAAGQLTSAVTPESALNVRYTNTGLIESIDNDGTPGAPWVEISYQYDANRNVIRVIDSLGGTTSYEYDALDRLVSLTQSGNLINEKRVDLTYDDVGILRELHRFSDLGRAKPVTDTFFDYDCPGCPMRLAAIRHRKSTDNSVIHDIEFFRNDTRDIVESFDADGSHIYAYDQLRRLQSADHSVLPDEFYDYDAVGNRLSSHLSENYTYSYMDGGSGNRLLSDDQFDYEYDNNGNLILKTDRISGWQTQYSYDHRNRLIGILKLNATGELMTQYAYQYDAANRRILANEDGDISYFIYDAHNPILDMDESGNVRTRRLYTRAIDSLLADEIQGQTRWFLNDQIGSVRNLVDNQAEQIARYTYDSFGRIVDESDGAVENHIDFSGREFDRDLGIGYYRARSYSPEIGRFLQEDPLPPFNYDYANNNPLIFRDPMGEVAAIEYGLTLYCRAADLAGKFKELEATTKVGPGDSAVGAAAGRIWKAGAGAILDGLEGNPVEPANVIRREALLGLIELEVALFNTALGDLKGFGLKVNSDGSLGLETPEFNVCNVKGFVDGLR